LIDTDVCIEILHKNQRVIDRRNLHDEGVAICFMSLAELYYGAARSSDPQRNTVLIDEFLLSLDIVQTDLSILKRYGSLKGDLKDRGLMLPDADILIAATAYEKARVLVTGNKSHFERFPALPLEDWIH
jgi:tRNA(fMet)-specific endonuclease VapC